MIGTLADATLALTHYGDGDYSHILSRDGSTRTVYLINDVVYKVEGVSWSGENYQEFLNISNNKNSLPEGVFYPDVSLFEIGEFQVIAMEYIEGQLMARCFCGDIETCTEDCMTNEVYELVSGVLDDLGGYNVIVNDEGVWIIDAA